MCRAICFSAGYQEEGKDRDQLRREFLFGINLDFTPVGEDRGSADESDPEPEPEPEPLSRREREAKIDGYVSDESAASGESSILGVLLRPVPHLPTPASDPDQRRRDAQEKRRRAEARFEKDEREKKEARRMQEQKQKEAKRERASKKEKEAAQRQKDADKRDKSITQIVSSLGLAPAGVAPRLALSLLDDFLKRPQNQENLPHESEEEMWATIKEFYNRNNPQGSGSALDGAEQKWKNIKERADRKAEEEQERQEKSGIRHQCKALDEMFQKFVGLEAVKKEALQIYRSVKEHRETGMSLKALNYIFFGNPGG